MTNAAELPQLEGGLFLTDGGIETSLIFHRRVDLPLFAAFVLLEDDVVSRSLRSYYAPYVSLARERDLGFILESPTWRASPRWAHELGYSLEDLDLLNRKAIALMEEIRAKFAGRSPCVISGCVGPRDDGYNPAVHMDARQAEEYHATQIGSFSETNVDMITATTMTYPEEAIGVARAAMAVGLPVVVSFTVETDGRLPNGRTLGSAIGQVDDATDGGVAYYMINCAHPTHFEDVIADDERWRERLRGLRANASMRSHAELDEAEDLDEGDPIDLAHSYAALLQRLPRLNVLGGCCGTDYRHIVAIADACEEAFQLEPEPPPRRMVDPALVGPFVEALDRAIDEVRRLEAGWRATGDQQGVELAQRMAIYLGGWRGAALEGRLPAHTGEFHIGISRFASEYMWGPHGEPFVDAAYEAERVWQHLEGLSHPAPT